MTSKKFLLVVAVVLACAMTASAHHSFAGTGIYIEGKIVALEGKVVKFDIRNPHSFLNFEVTDKNGKTTRWAGEWGSVTQLVEGGVTRFVIKPGDTVIVEGAPSLATTHRRILVRTVVRPATGTAPEFKWTGRVQ
jgi:Family of unknown function (DUF6152)